MKHPHYELIKAYYADPDAYTILVKNSSGTWVPTDTPMWNPDKQYRLAPQNRKLLPSPFPRPLVREPVVGTQYFIPRITGDHNLDTLTISIRWEGDQTDYRYLERAMIHLNRENAIEHAKAFILASGGSFMPREEKEEEEVKR